MYIEDGKFVYESKTCASCEGFGKGARYRSNCKTCKGTGRGPRGEKRRCKACYGRGWEYQTDMMLPCPVCKGTGRVKQSRCDRVPLEIVAKLPIRILIRRGGNTFNESYLGVGCVWSVADYGTAYSLLRRGAELKELSERVAEFQKRIKEQLTQRSTQAIHISTEDGTLCDFIAVIVNSGGYSLRAMYGPVESADVDKQDKSEASLFGDDVTDALYKSPEDFFRKPKE